MTNSQTGQFGGRLPRGVPLDVSLIPSRRKTSSLPVRRFPMMACSRVSCSLVPRLSHAAFHRGNEHRVSWPAAAPSIRVHSIKFRLGVCMSSSGCCHFIQAEHEPTEAGRVDVIVIVVASLAFLES